MFKSSSKDQSKCNIRNLINGDIDVQGILTSRICAEIVVEIIKLLSHQKLQIPFKYEVLKHLVEKRKKIENETENVQQESGWQTQKYFHTISTALNVLDNIFKNITLEMDSCESPEEIYIIFGSTPAMPKEVFRILLPQNLHVHYHQNHSQNLRNILFDTMRKIISSSDLSQAIYHPIQPTNMFVAFNRKPKISNGVFGERRAFSEFFHPIQHLKISSKVTQTVINLNYTTPSDVNCCHQMLIFKDFSIKCNVSDVTEDVETSKNEEIKTDLLLVNDLDNITNDDNSDGITSALGKTVFKDVSVCTEGVKPSIYTTDCVGLSDEEIDWFQSSMVLKGFKDCFINGKSISNSWLNS